MIETKIIRQAKLGGAVLVEVTPNCNGNNLVSESISIYAIDQHS